MKRRLCGEWPLDKPRPSAVLDHARTLVQHNWRARPALDREAISPRRELVILDAGNVLDDVLAAGVPHMSIRQAK
jgi:hypothetical protein